MNKEELLSLADHLDTIPEDHFDHATWASSSRNSSCGTVACVAGHQVWRTMPEKFAALMRTGDTYLIADIAKDQLGLTFEQCRALFFPWNSEYLEDYRTLTDYNYATSGPKNFASAKQAAKVIRHFVETGLIDWTVAIPKEQQQEPIPPIDTTKQKMNVPVDQGQNLLSTPSSTRIHNI